MAVLVHVGSRSYVLDESQLATDALTKRIDDSTTAGTPFRFPALIGGSKIAVFVNPALVDVIAVDPDGAGLGFFHV